MPESEAAPGGLDAGSGARTPVAIVAERRRTDRRKVQVAIFTDRRLRARRQTDPGFLTRVRAFFGLPPLD